jgi:flagellar hook assembly protein FlgD
MVNALTLEFEVREAGDVEVAIYDAAGRLVRNLATGALPLGYQSRTWDGKAEDGRAAPNGVYFYRITMPDRAVTSKFVVTRGR